MDDFRIIVIDFFYLFGDNFRGDFRSINIDGDFFSDDLSGWGWEIFVLWNCDLVNDDFWFKVLWDLNFSVNLLNTFFSWKLNSSFVNSLFISWDFNVDLNWLGSRLADGSLEVTVNHWAGDNRSWGSDNGRSRSAVNNCRNSRSANWSSHNT